MVTPILKEQIVQRLNELSAEDLAEVARYIDFLLRSTKLSTAVEQSERGSAFGIWADYEEAGDAASFGVKLRQKVESRQDAFPNTVG